MERHPPLFIEVVHSAEHANIQICRKIMAILFRQRIAPLPFASSIKELREVLNSLRTRGLAPSVLVVNTFWAEELLSELKPFTGNTPVLFFKRQMFSEGTGIISRESGRMAAPSGPCRVTTILEKLAHGQTCTWTYGSKNSDEMAAKTAAGLVQFLNDGNFAALSHAQLNNADIAAALRGNSDDVQRLLGENRLTQPAGTATVSAGAPAWPASASLSGLNGAISQMGVSTLIAMLEMEKKSGGLQLARQDDTIQMHFCKGLIVQASVNGPSAVTVPAGAESVYFALTWRNGLINFDSKEIEMADEINLPTTRLLMEGARRLDTPISV